jgi:hypothetical protein
LEVWGGFMVIKDELLFNSFTQLDNEEQTDEQREQKLRKIAEKLLKISNSDEINLMEIKGQYHYSRLLCLNIIIKCYDDFSKYPMISITKYLNDSTEPLYVLTSVYNLMVKHRFSLLQLLIAREIEIRNAKFDLITPDSLALDNYYATEPLKPKNSEQEKVVSEKTTSSDCYNNIRTNFMNNLKVLKPRLK